MSLDCPAVSICLPVYNGEHYVRETIDSILKQTFEDFELIISDNASTDSTPVICQNVLARDCRVRYFRSEVNRGLAWNHNRTFELARGRYIAWIGHDDRMAKEYITRCVEALEKDPEAVLCYAGYNHIDEGGSLIKRTPLENTGAFESPRERFFHIIYDVLGCLPIYGIMRAQILKQTCLYGGFAESDRVLLAEMGLRGRFILVPEYLISRRQHAERNCTKYPTLRERTLIFDPEKAGKVFSQVMLEMMAFCSAINRARIPLIERLWCYRYLLGWLWVWRRYILLDDLQDTIKRYLSENQVRRLKAVKHQLLNAWKARGKRETIKAGGVSRTRIV